MGKQPSRVSASPVNSARPELFSQSLGQEPGKPWLEAMFFSKLLLLSSSPWLLEAGAAPCLCFLGSCGACGNTLATLWLGAFMREK